MNNSNRYGIEWMARQRQAEIEQQLRQSAILRKGGKPSEANPRLQVQWVAIWATGLSVLGTVALIVITHAH